MILGEWNTAAGRALAAVKNGKPCIGLHPTSLDSVVRSAPDIIANSRRTSSNWRSSNGSAKGSFTRESYHVLLLFAYCDILFSMALRECRVTFRDVRDIDHSVTVHAETTMDAAALGLNSCKGQGACATDGSKK
jgi:hypothetical protein